MSTSGLVPVRTLDDEVASLERVWQDAEQIAALADDSLLPESVHGPLARIQERAGRRRR